MTESEHPQEPVATPAEPAGTSEAGARDEDEARFVEGLVVRGEVAPAGSDPLPPGATHEVVEEDEDGVPTQVRRRRFSAH